MKTLLIELRNGTVDKAQCTDEEINLVVVDFDKAPNEILSDVKSIFPCTLISETDMETAIDKIIEQNSPFRFLVNNEVPYLKIEEVVQENSYEIESNGPERVGENFLTVRNPEKDQVASFVLTGGSGKGFIYKCVYSDF